MVFASFVTRTCLLVLNRVLYICYLTDHLVWCVCLCVKLMPFELNNF